MDLFQPLDVTNPENPYSDVPDPLSSESFRTQEDIMDPALVAALQQYELSVFEDAPSGTEIGINVSWFSGSNANDLVPFVNQLKGARPWDDPADSGRMTYDENGYPTTIPSHYVVSQLLIRSADVEGIPPHTGAFRLYGQGSGTISLVSSTQGTLHSRLDTDALPTEIIAGESFWHVDLDFSVQGVEIAQLRMLIHGIEQGDHIRDLALVHETHLDAHRAGEVFAPEFVADLQGYGTLRLMDWMRANKIEEDGNGWGPEGSDWTSPDPEQRHVGADYFTFNNHAGGAANEGRFEVSVPIEHIVALANAVDADPWITLPVDILDSRVEQIATYVAEHLEEGLTARWEYGNELFNDAIGFEGYRYSVAMARATFADFDAEGPWAAVEWAAYRGPQVYGIIRDVLQEHGDTMRSVAPGWAFSGSLRPNGELTDGYLVRYFAAGQSRLMNDGTPLPFDVVTDYSVAMYYGGTLAEGRPDGRIAHHVLQTVEGADAQADALAAWLMFGSDPALYHEVTVANLTEPLTGLTWSGDLDIGVTPLIWADIKAGLDPLTGLETVLRLDGAALQYRGVNSAGWTDVVVFDQIPDRTLAGMIEDLVLVGHGGRQNGVAYTGLSSGLANSVAMRLDAHAGYAEALGLNFIAYEGGSHVSYPVEGGFGMYEAFNTSAAGARVFARWLELMSAHGLDGYVHFMSHDRTNGNDWWGVQDHVGQDIAAKPEALVLRAAMAAYDPGHDPAARGPLAGAQSVSVTTTGALSVDLPVVWKASGTWTVHADGSATESGGTITQLTLQNLLPVREGARYVLDFDIGLEGSDATEIRVVARALGAGAEDLLRWQGVVTDKGSVSLDLGEIPAGMSSLYLVVQRVGADRSGSLTVTDADLAEVGPLREGALGAAFAAESITGLAELPWAAGRGWSLSGAGTAVAEPGATGRLSLGDLLEVVPATRYAVGFTVGLEGAPGTQLRLIGRAMGGGADEVLRWREDVTHGQVVTPELEAIPDGRALLDPVFSRGGAMAGTVTPLAPVAAPVLA